MTALANVGMARFRPVPPGMNDATDLLSALKIDRDRPPPRRRRAARAALVAIVLLALAAIGWIWLNRERPPTVRTATVTTTAARPPSPCGWR